MPYLFLKRKRMALFHNGGLLLNVKRETANVKKKESDLHAMTRLGQGA